MVFFHRIVPWLSILNLINGAEIVDKADEAPIVKTENAPNSAFINSLNSFNAVSAAEDVDADDDVEITALEKSAFKRFIQEHSAYDYFSSYKLPDRSDLTDELLDSLKRTSDLTFYNSMHFNQFLRHERPGYIFLIDQIHEICAEFRASKPSIDPKAFTKPEKFAFIERMSEMGMFFNTDNLKTGHRGSNKKKNAETKENLKFRAIFSGSAASSYYCRDALRIVAGVLDASQITWLLDYSPATILNSSEFLDQLNDFSMFQDFQVVESSKFGNYDWFKNANALKTLKPKALLGFFEYLKFHLSSEQLELINAARPIKELFETPEFRASAFAWQITAGTKFYLEKHLNIDGLVDEISKVPDSFDISNSRCPDHIRQAIFGFYFHSENAIVSHCNGIITIGNLNEVKADATSSKVKTDDTNGSNSAENTIANSGISSDNNIVSSTTANVDNTTIANSTTMIQTDFETAALREESQLNVISFRFNALEYVFNHRAKILSVLLNTFKNLTEIDAGLQNLIGYLAAPSLYVMRKAMAVLAEVKTEFSSEPTLNELLGLLKKCNSSKCDFCRRHALILAYFELKYAPLKCPYRYISNSKPYSTFEMLHKVRLIGGMKFENNVLSSTKWPLAFLFHQALDFKYSTEIQLKDHNDNSDVVTTLNAIINDSMLLCDKKGLNEHFVAIIKSIFPENCHEFVNAVENLHSVQTRYKEFVISFKNNLMCFKLSKTNLDELESALPSIIRTDYYETQLMVAIQNLFTVEMVGLLSEDTEILTEFCEFAYLLTRNQVKELLSNEAGRRLFAENRNLVHNLPTYEDFKVTDLKPLKLQAQYATMVRTMSALPLLVSLRSDDYIIDDPLGLSMRLFSFNQLEFWSQQANGEILRNLWRFVPVQMMAEFQNTELLHILVLIVSRVRNYLRDSKEVQGKVFESIRAVLHWTILQEIRFLETFTLMNSNATDKMKEARKLMILLNQNENSEREYLISEWFQDLASSDDAAKMNSGTAFLKDLLNVLSGPIGQTRAGSLLTGSSIMDKNIRFFFFNESFSTFFAWTRKALETVGLSLSPIRTGKYMSVGQSVELKLESSCVFHSASGYNSHSHTNIPQYREYIEEDTAVRREKLNQLLDQVNAILGVKADPNAQLWKDRIKMIGILSADGFTLSPNYNTDEKLNLTVHERIIQSKLLNLSDDLYYNFDSMSESQNPRNMATTVFRIVPIAEPVTSAVEKNSGKSKKVSDKQKKRK